MKLFLKVVLSVFLLFVLVAGGALFFLTSGLEAGSKIEANSVDLTLIDDGTYSGNFDEGRWSNELIVTVRDHKITEVDIVNDVLFPKEGVAEQLENSVVENQSIEVDAVAGATITSKAYLKSIENALTKNMGGETK